MKMASEYADFAEHYTNKAEGTMDARLASVYVAKGQVFATLAVAAAQRETTEALVKR